MPKSKRDIELQLLAAMEELLTVYQDQIAINESQIRDLKSLQPIGVGLIDKLTATD